MVCPIRTVFRQDGLLVILEVVLRKHRKAFARAQFNSSLVGFQLTADSLQQGGFTGTIGTDDTVDVARCELDIYIFVEYTFAKLNG